MNDRSTETRVTAYVFEEMSPEDMDAFEKELEGNLELQAEVDIIREAIRALKTEFAAEVSELAEDCRAKVGAANQDRSTKPLATNRRWLKWAALAASVMFLGLLGRSWYVFNIASRQNSLTAQSNSHLTQLGSSLSNHTDFHSEPVSDFGSAVFTVEEFGRESAVGKNQQHVVVAPSLMPLAAEPGKPEQVAVVRVVPAPAASEAKTRWRLEAQVGKEVMPFAAPAPNQENGLRFKKHSILSGYQFYGTGDDYLKLEPKGLSVPSRTLGEELGADSSGDRYDFIEDAPFRSSKSSPLSTFSIDVDTASYAKVRMYLMQHGQLPRPDAVRIEEMINYFGYDYEAPAPDDEHPFSTAMSITECPWNPNHRLARIGIKGRAIESDRPASNLVFLLDVSGSMNRPNKLPLVLEGMKMLVSQLTENDSVAIVVYAGAAGMVLDSTSGDRKQTIVEALDRLRAGGSTAGGEGIQLAYQVARDHFIAGGTNRVILCSDGDFNVGVTGTDQLVRIVADNAKANIFLSVLGFGMGNHNDSMMEQISNKGNGNYAFIDTRTEARKVLVDQMGARW